MASDEYGSTDTLSSTTSSEASENYSPSTMVLRRKKVIHNVSVSNVSGCVAYGSRSAKIQVPGGENSANATSPQTETLTGVGDVEYDREQQETEYDREQIPGSYCVYRRHSEPLFQDEKAPWKARARKGIVTNKRDEEFEWSIESFFQDLDLFIQEMDKTGDIVMKQRESFILQVILPHLETSWDKSVSSKGEVYKNLAKISRSANSGIVVRNCLNLLLHLICRDNFDRGAESLLIVEKVMRSSIFSQNGMFKNDEHGEQNLKLFVYSRILSLLLLQQERAVTLPINDLKKVQEVIKQRRKEVKKKDRLRYSLEIIIDTISYLLKQHDNTITGTIVEECQQFCKSSNMEARNLQILQTLGRGVDLHYILIHLYGKVHSERPVPQLETERLAMKLIRLIVEDYFNRDGGAQERWKFCLLASSILADITQNSVTKELRTEAGGCLANILRNEKVQKRPECRLIVEKMCSEVLFCPDNETRTFLLHFSNKNKNLEDSLLADQQTKQLCLAYRTQRLEINATTISKKTDSFVNHGEFQGKKVAIKVLNVKKKHLLEDNPEFKARERLIQEAYNMRRLNASKHSNFPVLLAYDTQSLPYHVITEFESFGNVLKFVQNSREDHQLTLRSNQLLLMLKDITDALLHLEKLGLVHRAIMAENVLVGDNYVCKLSGLHAMKELTGLDTLDDYCSADLPDFVSLSNDDDLPIRWKAPECVTVGRYSTASDVWAFGVLAYEVLTFGCTPYRNLSKDEDVRNRVVEFKEIVQKEDCFQDKEFELIKQCCEWQMIRRLNLSQVRERLEEMNHLYTGNSEPRSDLPPLGIQQIVRENSDFDCEEIYDSITEVSEDSTDYDSLSFDEYGDTCETFTADPVKEYIQGCNRLVPEHVEHVEKLRSLKHVNLAPFLKVMHHDSLECPSNLKEYVLDRRCNLGDMVMFLSQVASAFHYLHANHILHGDLRAEHVNVIAPNKVQVGHLDRFKYLSMSAYEATSTTCVVEATPPPDSIRWCAPEVISDGRFTHASDVWAFGILAWELYESFRTGQENRELSVPYHSLDNNEILNHMTDKGPMKQPEFCPHWVYILMHQCWAFESVQRPPFLAIFDCLTSREPMKSWMMKCWLQTHSESEWPDLNVCQTEDSFHVLHETLHPSPKNIEKMCSDEYFGKHTYIYDKKVNEYLGEDESLYTYARCEVAANSLEDTSGYLCPKESCVDAFKSKKRSDESGEAFLFSKTKRVTVSSKLRKAEDVIPEDRNYENMQQNGKAIPYHAPAEENRDYQNVPLSVAQNHVVPSKLAINKEKCEEYEFICDSPEKYDQEDKENKDCQATTALEDSPPTIHKRKRNAPRFKAKRRFKWQPEHKEYVYENAFVKYPLTTKIINFEDSFWRRRDTFNHVTVQLGAF